MANEPARDIPQILFDLKETEKHLLSCRARTDDARTQESAALSCLNRLQEELERKITEIRTNAPRDSKWHRDQQPHFAAKP